MTPVVVEPKYRKIIVTGGRTVTVQKGNTVIVQERGVQGAKGDTGATGPVGPVGPGTLYVHDQTVPASEWIIVHNSNAFLNVTIVDSAGSEVEGEVTYVSGNEIRVTFNGAFSGKAYLS